MEAFGVLVLGVGAAAVLALMFSGWWGGWGWWGDRGDVTQTVTVNVDASKATEQANAVAVAALGLAMQAMGRPQQAALPAAQAASVEPPRWLWSAERAVYFLPQPDGSVLVSDSARTWREALPPPPPAPRITVMGQELPAPAPHWMDGADLLDAERDAADALSRRLPAPRGGR